MPDIKNYAHVLTEALPFIRRYEGKTVVVKYGGNAMTEPHLKDSFASDMVLMKKVGINPVIVHGGGPQINETLNNQGIVSRFENGMRVTDEKTMQIVEMVLGGSVNKEIVSNLNKHGGYGVGLTGKDAGLIKASKMQVLDKDGNLVDIGFVGEVEEINSNLVEVLESHRFIPVIAPIGSDDNGVTYNINADIVAGELAAKLNAERLLLLTNTPGVQNDQGELISELSQQETQKLIDDKVISGGMLPKVQCALDAVEKGVKGAVILDGRVEHAALLEIFSDQGVGTIFV